MKLEQFMMNKRQILYTTQLIASVLVALEIAIPPNPYIFELIFTLTVLICIKYDLPNKVVNVFEKYHIKIKKLLLDNK